MKSIIDEARYERVISDLTYKFDGIFSPESITAAVLKARSELEPHSKIPDFLPILTEKFAREQLTAAAQAEGRIAKAVPEILFVCVQNAGRSQMAAALAEYLAPGKVHVRTAGSKPADSINPDVITVLGERGIDLTEAYPKPLSDSVINAADVIITMGCGDACPIYPGKRYEDWQVPDPAGQSLEAIRDIRDDIQARVTALLRDLVQV